MESFSGKRVNNPARRTTLREELEALGNLRKEHRLGEKKIARALGRRPDWVRRRLRIAERLDPEVADVLGDRLFRPSIALLLSRLPTGEQLPTALSIVSAGLSLRDTGRFLKVLSSADASERDQLRQDPRLEAENRKKEENGE